MTENRQTDRESNYRGHSNRRWIVGLSGPIMKCLGPISLWARLLLVTLQCHNPNSTTTPQSICRDRNSKIYITLLHCAVTMFGEIHFHKGSGYFVRITYLVTFSMYGTLTCSTYAHTSLQYMFLLWY